MAIVLSAYVPIFAQTLFTLAKDEVALLMGIGDEIERLRSRLERMLPVLADADMQRLQDKAIRSWVQQLRDVMYHAEDIIEGYKIETGKLKRSGSQRPSSSSSSTSSSSLLSLSVSFCYSPLSCFSYYAIRGHQIGSKIKNLNRKLDDILNDISVHNLRSVTPAADCNTAANRISRRTSSVVEPNLVGERIRDDTKMLVDHLLRNSHGKQRQRKFSVFAIVGMAGIGKTTLAKEIFNDDKLRRQFCPVWICVSHDFSEEDILRAVIVRAGGIPGDHAKDKTDLEPMLYEIVKDKKLFLVLDDVWDARVWGKLLHQPLQSVSAGSVLLVTTRHEAVATHMRAIHKHRVQKLPDEDGWSLLSSMVFDDDKDVDDIQSRLRDIGMGIVNKCGGLPLAIKSIAGVLCCKDKRRHDWEKVLQSPAWSFTDLPNDVTGVLYLSYAELPSHLKQCFLYFALFPEDAEFQRSHIIRLWIAEGFVEEKENRSKEELGKEYWKELVHRSLLQPHGGWYDTSLCKMHDLVHSLAQHLASDECFSQDMTEFNNKTTSCSSWSLKPLRVSIRNGEGIPQVIRKHVSLRTLLLPFHRNFTKDALGNLRYLRILSFSNSSIENLPESIGGLLLLRYLDLSKSAIREIPENIGSLENLQFLIMPECKNLHDLPKSITNLQNLRCLDLTDTEIHFMPVGIGKLQNLVLLYGFQVSNSHIDYSKRKRNQETKQLDYQHKSSGNYCNIEELGLLSQLNSLSVHKLERASGKIVARAAALGSKTNLVYLGLHCTECSSDVEPHVYYGEKEIEKILIIFEELRPPPRLEFLRIHDYFGLEYPSWMTELSSSFLPNLRRLELKNCLLCGKLPPLGMLPQLDCLWIEGAPAVKSIGPELFGVCSRGGKSLCPRSSFPKLEVLHLEGMPEWEEWSWLIEEDDQETMLLPSLHTLVIVECPKLRSLPESLLNRATALTCLWINGAQSLSEVKNLLHVKELTLMNNPRLERVSNFPSVKKLCIDDCEELKAVESLDALQHLDLKGSGLGSLPDWLCIEGVLELRFAALRRLVIEGNAQLLSRCLVGGPDWHKMRKIPCVDVYHCDAPTYYVHFTKSPFSFDTNLSSYAISQQQGREQPKQ